MGSAGVLRVSGLLDYNARPRWQLDQLRGPLRRIGDENGLFRVERNSTPEDSSGDQAATPMGR